MSVYPERRSGRLSGKWIAEVTLLGVRVRKRYDSKHEADHWADTTKLTGEAPLDDPGKQAVVAVNTPIYAPRSTTTSVQLRNKHIAPNGKSSPATINHYKRRLPDEDLSAVKKLAGALQVFSSERRTMPMQYVQSFLLVAEKEGLGVTDYAQRAGVSVSVMSRHLLDIGERDRYMKPGLGWVTARLNPMELRKKEYFVTDKGMALIHQFKRQLSE